MSHEWIYILVIYPIVAIILCAAIWFGLRALRSRPVMLDEDEADLWRNW